MGKKALKLERFMARYSLDLSDVKKLTITVDTPWPHEPPETTLEMVLSSRREGDKRTVKLIFHNVRLLTLQKQMSLFTLSQLTIRCIEEQQWEDTFFRVIEEEDNALSFYCRDFDFEFSEDEALYHSH